MPHEQPWLDKDLPEPQVPSQDKGIPMQFKKVIQEYCPLLNNELDAFHLSEPKILGAENTRRLMTQAYGMHLNGYSISNITDTVNDLFRVSLDQTDIKNIIWATENEARIASIQTHL